MAEDWERAVQEQQREWGERQAEEIQKVYAKNGCLIVFAIGLSLLIAGGAIASIAL